MKLKLKGKNIYYYMFLEVNTRVKRLEKSVLKENKINIRPKALVYISLIDAYPKITHSQLLNFLDVSKGALSNMVSTLLRKVIIKKVIDKVDKRTHHYTLTRKGKKIAKVNDKIRTTIRDYISESLSKDEIQTVMGALEKLRE